MKMMAMLLALCLFLPAMAEDMDEAWRLWDDGYCDEAYEIALPLAEAGDAEAQYLLSEMYYYGEGVEHSLREAVYWARLAAAQGSEDAESFLEYYPCDEPADTSELITFEKGLGSAVALRGNVVIVSLFVNDQNTRWDPEDPDDADNAVFALENLDIATEWLTDQAAAWDVPLNFIYDRTEEEDLVYDIDVAADLVHIDEDAEPHPHDAVCEAVRKVVDEQALRAKYGADSVVYMAFLNTPYENEEVSYTYSYDDSAQYTEEIVYILTRCEDEEETPAAYAHEILHTFGAYDYYTSANPEYNGNITNGFVFWCDENCPDEIMVTTFDVGTEQANYDAITGTLTAITAYYVGWTDDRPRIADVYGLAPTQH